jgi:V8-like Glu-specific endopeptidase
MRAADRATVLAGNGTFAVASGARGRPRTPRWLRESSKARLLPSNVPGVRAVGRLFALRNGLVLACTATLVDSANGSTVWTAGHCLHEAGHWDKKVVFVPDYQPGGRAPLGVWPAVAEATPPAWQRHGDVQHFRQDFGAIVVARNRSGRTLAQVVGAAQHIAFGPAPSRRVWALGFPAAKPFNGQRLWACGPHSLGRLAFIPGPGPVPGAMRCDMTPGASGGPWLARISLLGIGTVFGDTSVLGRDDGRVVIAGPMLGSSARKLYLAVEKR